MEIAGRADFAGVENGFFFRDGHFTIVDYPGVGNSDDHGINDRGEISGSYIDSNGVYHGFETRISARIK
jgi:hypothetical protein